jgi:glucose/arabinose dehydrogenase
MRRSWVLITIFAAACGSSTPAPPATGGSGGTESITGRERIGWDQPAANAADLADLRYAVYVDDVRNEMPRASCTPTVGAVRFACTGPLPSMTGGAHTLEIVAVNMVDGESVESTRSTPLHVVVSTALTASITAPAAQWQNGAAAPTRDGIELQVARIAEGVSRPVDAAFAPDGRLFLVERNRIRVVSGTQLQTSPALSLSADDPSQQLLSIAFDPDFDHTRLVFLLQASDSADDPIVYLSRYREVRGTLGQRAVLFQSPVEAAANASGMMRFGQDGKLYVAIGGSNGTGKVFRLNADGTMPRDQAGTTPAVAGGVADAHGLAWDARLPGLWIVDGDSDTSHLSGVSMSSPPVRAVARSRDNLPQHSGSMVVYTGDAATELRNNALIASADGYILRLRFADDDPSRVLDSERLLEDRVGPIRVLAAGPDGAIYFCTDTALGRLTFSR